MYFSEKQQNAQLGGEKSQKYQNWRFCLVPVPSHCPTTPRKFSLYQKAETLYFVWRKIVHIESIILNGKTL